MTTAGVLGYLLGPVVVASAALVLIVLALHAGRRDRSRGVFLILLLTLELWLVCTFFMRFSPDTGTAALWDRAVSFWIFSAFITYFHFCYVYIAGSRRWPVVAAYAFLAVGAAAILPTNLVITRMVVAPYGYAPVVSPVGIPLFLGSWVLVGAGIVLALRAYRRSAGGEERYRFLYLAVAGFFPLIGAGLDGFSNLPPVGIWTNLVFSAICTVAVLKYRLLDIRIVARRSLSRLLVSTIVAIPYIGALALLNAVVHEPVAWWIYAVGVLLFAALLRPLYGSVQELVERMFYGQRYDHLLALRNFSREASSAVGLHEASERLVELVRGSLQASSAVLLQPSPDGMSLSAVADPRRYGLRVDGPLVRWLERHRTVLPRRALAGDPDLKDLPESDREALRLMDAQLLAPVFVPQRGLAGVIVLGPKDAAGSYTIEDIHLLESVGTQAAMALETSRLYASAERSRRTLEAWLQGVPDSVVIVEDAEHLVRFANKAAEQRLGVRAGHHWMLGRHDETERMHETILGREYEIASAPLLESDGTTGLICVLRDITERKEQEEARAEWERRVRITGHLASIGEMAAGIAHEINNPLTAVIGYSDMLAMMKLEGEAGEAAAQIHDGAKRVAAITQRLLTFARQKKPERRPVDLNAVARSTVELRSYSLRTSNVKVALDLDPRLPRTVADAQQMQQVLLNLIINAESAMTSAHGCGVLTVRTRSGDAGVQMLVADDGSGVPEELQERIFDPFFTTKEVGQGSGLGLSICHGIVSEHGGTISLRNLPAGGAEFCVEIPVVAAADDENQGSEVQSPQAGPRAGARILVVDDEPGVRGLLEKALSSDGHVVESVSDGTTALARILSGGHDIVMLDIRMPGMSGVDVHERVSRERPQLARRIVLMTGDVMAAETRAFVERTGARCITKPFDVRTILGVVRDIIRERDEP